MSIIAKIRKKAKTEEFDHLFLIDCLSMYKLNGFWNNKQKLTKADLIKLFDKKIMDLDIKSAKNDIINFIKDFSQIELWSKDFFKKIIKKIITI